jgi:hypothetical protein
VSTGEGAQWPNQQRHACGQSGRSGTSCALGRSRSRVAAAAVGGILRAQGAPPRGGIRNSRQAAKVAGVAGGRTVAESEMARACAGPH